MATNIWKCLVFAVVVLGAHAWAAPLVWHVSPEGRDSWSGTLATANAEKTDGPFATLMAARDASRKQGGKPRQIVLSTGRFYLKETLVLDARDSHLTLKGAGQGKTVVYGGRRLDGWLKDGDRFWSVKLPADKPDWSFRLLVVNDRVQDRARYPAEGYLEHETKFPVRWMSTAGGGWERKPTLQEYTTMVYKKGDLPADLSVESAEVTICHMWDESTLPIAKHDPIKQTLVFARRGAHPPGAFNVRRYAIWNTRGGMTRPGQWYLDKRLRKVYYWPREGEDMGAATVVAPVIVKIISVTGNKKGKCTGLTIRGMTISTGDASAKRAGFGGASWPGAINTDGAGGVRIENVEVTNVGGWGVRGGANQVVNCHLHHLGGGGVKYWGEGLVEGTHIHDIGLVSANCIGIMGGGVKSVIRR
ncbi:MAG: right-handed parallel beta-helix repeat-containing protein, partial [Lentisphaeria bacterium]|nr:right-handed parallel beta-helix repeat-containing protein [Lentisphaeria bacterium]